VEKRQMKGKGAFSVWEIRGAVSSGVGKLNLPLKERAEVGKGK